MPVHQNTCRSKVQGVNTDRSVRWQMQSSGQKIGRDKGGGGKMVKMCTAGHANCKHAEDDADAEDHDQDHDEGENENGEGTVSRKRSVHL